MSKAVRPETHTGTNLQESIPQQARDAVGGDEAFVIESFEEEDLLSSILGGHDARALARKIRTRYPDLVKLRRASSEDLTGIPGLDAARASALRAAIEIGRRIVATPWPPRGSA